jgi:SnoaL-like domain
MPQPAATSQIERIKEFYRRSDAGEFAAELFAPDCQFYWPKFGVGRGSATFLELAGALRSQLVQRVSHHLDELLFIEQGNRVAVEGTTEGVGVDGVAWHGGRTPGGRFCSVFVFNPKGLIERMHVYLDPDLTGRDQLGFIWKGRLAQRW